MRHSDQVTHALKSLHPDVRRDIRRALDDVDAGRKRDTKALKSPLDGFHRVRIGKYRVIYRRHPDSGVLIAEFLEIRSTIYENFQPPS